MAIGAVGPLPETAPDQVDHGVRPHLGPRRPVARLGGVDDPGALQDRAQRRLDLGRLDVGHDHLHPGHPVGQPVAPEAPLGSVVLARRLLLGLVQPVGPDDGLDVGHRARHGNLDEGLVDLGRRTLCPGHRP
jgi:hypothetical protein